MNPLSDPSELGERVITGAQNLLKKGQAVARREGRVLKLQTQISGLRSRRHRLITQMGAKVFELFERDLVKNQELRMTCQEVRGVDAEIALRREEIEQLRAAAHAAEGGVEGDESPVESDIAPVEESEEV